MRVLGLINSIGQGGAERSLLDLAQELARTSGITTRVLTTRTVDHGFQSQAVVNGVDVKALPSGALSQLRDLRQHLKTGDYDLVWTTLWEADLLGRLGAWRTGVPVLTSLVNTSYDPVRRKDPLVNPWKLEIARTLDGWTARHLTSHFHAISEAVAQHAVDQLGIAPHSITIIPRGRRPQDFRPLSQEETARVRANLGVSRDDFMIANVGRHEFQKGQEHLIDAMALLVSAIPRAVLVVAGRSGNATRKLEDRIAVRGLQGRVRLLGDRRDIADILGAADIFVFPSLYEGLGGAMIEAMAARLPIVASNLPAVVEAAGSAAILTPPGDGVALAKAMFELSANRPLREKLAAQAFARFNRSFTLERTARQTADLLRFVGGASRLQGPR